MLMKAGPQPQRCYEIEIVFYSPLQAAYIKINISVFFLFTTTTGWWRKVLIAVPLWISVIKIAALWTKPSPALGIGTH